MDPTSLDALLKEGGIVLIPDGLRITINPLWVLKGEDRLSYTTLVRLVECCREYHWKKDILSRMNDQSIDSITKSIDGQFTKPILIGEEIFITYSVSGVRKKGYSIKFIVRKKPNEICAIFFIAYVFYDPENHCVSEPPNSVYKFLKSNDSLQRESISTKKHKFHLYWLIQNEVGEHIWEEGVQELNVSKNGHLHGIIKIPKNGEVAFLNLEGEITREYIMQRAYSAENKLSFILIVFETKLDQVNTNVGIKITTDPILVLSPLVISPDEIETSGLWNKLRGSNVLITSFD